MRLAEKPDRLGQAGVLMKLATVRVGSTTQAAILDGDRYLLLDQRDIVELLRAGLSPSNLRPQKAIHCDAAVPATLLPRPSKILCIGLNYRSHAEEMGVQPPTFPGMWAKFPSSLIGARDPIALPRASDQCDYEVELGIVIGKSVRYASEIESRDAIAGYTVCNDASVRDWQFRTREALQGKAWDNMTPVGPVLVTPDEVAHAEDLGVECYVDGEKLQDGRTSDLVFSPAELVSYISTFTTLEPGDLILTGTPSGVGFKRNPPRYLRPGQTITTRIEKIGELVNTCVAEHDWRPASCRADSTIVAQTSGVVA